MALFGITRYPFSGKARFCIALRNVPKHFSLCRMITNVRIKTFSHTISCTVLFCVPKDKTNPLAICYNCIRRDSNPRISSLTGSRSKCSSGIHFGISSCTAVKDQLKHRLEVTLQAYFTIPFTVFHGKKAAKTTKKPSNESFFAILIRSLTVFSAFR